MTCKGKCWFWAVVAGLFVLAFLSMARHLHLHEALALGALTTALLGATLNWLFCHGRELVDVAPRRAASVATPAAAPLAAPMTGPVPAETPARPAVAAEAAAPMTVPAEPSARPVMAAEVAAPATVPAETPARDVSATERAAPVAGPVLAEPPARPVMAAEAAASMAAPTSVAPSLGPVPADLPRASVPDPDELAAEAVLPPPAVGFTDTDAAAWDEAPEAVDPADDAPAGPLAAPPKPARRGEPQRVAIARKHPPKTTRTGARAAAAPRAAGPRKAKTAKPPAPPAVEDSLIPVEDLAEVNGALDADEAAVEVARDETVEAPVLADRAVEAVAAPDEVRLSKAERKAAKAARRAAREAEDELRRIDGMGPKARAALHALGVSRVAQVAGWDAGDRARMDAVLGRKRGLAEIEAWVEAARRVALRGEVT